MQKTASIKPAFLLTTLIILTSIFCKSEPEIQSPEKIIEISFETQTMTVLKTKVKLPTLISSNTTIPFSTITLKTTSTQEEWTITPTKWIYKSSTPKPTPLCYCNRDYDCNHFYTQKQAQFCFNYCNGSIDNDWSGLDSDHDAIACENLP